MIVDFHTHLQDIKNYSLGGITPFISGYSPSSNKKAISLAKELNVPYYIGLAPQEAQRMSKEEIDNAIEFIKINSKYAIGEIGLDFHWAKSKEERELQYYAFEKQISLAISLNLPIVIHSRKSEEEILSKLIEFNFNNKVAFHFFSSTPSFCDKALSHIDAYFSIIIHPSKERKKSIAKLPLSRLLVETDSPYVGETPMDVLKSIKYISSIKGLDENEVIKQTSLNSFNFIKYP